MRTQIISGLLACAVVAGSAAAAENDFETGRKLLQAGRDVEAFRAFLKVPGAEHLAVGVARPKAAEFLALLADLPANIPAARVQLIEGDLKLAQGNKAAALRCYRTAAAKLAVGEYYVEWSRTGDSAQVYEFDFSEHPVLPFEAGPGSHRDNWLLRRFIALEAWDDAAREFTRIWAVHRNNTRPHVRVEIYPGNPPDTNRVAVKPCGFDGRALQFALDYAFFLKQRGNTKAALAVLSEPLLTMDMDRLPAGHEVPLAAGQTVQLPERIAPSPWSSWQLACAGLSRKEFIRLTYGEFKIAGQVERLDDTIRKQIAVGENRARRVLARIRTHEGRTDEAVALELAYVEAGKFDPVTTAIRRGQVYEDAGRLADAAAEYEKALALPFISPSLPDEDEEAVQSSMMSQMPRQLLRAGRESAHAQEFIQRDLLGRLQRLYAALGKSDRAMEVALRLTEMSDGEMGSLERLEQTVSRFRTAGKEAEIMAWLAGRADTTTTKPHVRANLRWLLGDKDGTIKAVAEVAALKQGDFGDAILPWKERFRNAGVEPYRRLLEALVAANPRDMQTQLEWLDSMGRLDGPEVIPVLEQLLESDALSAFPHGKGAQNRTHFRNYADLAYRLFRLYERYPGNEEKLLALGFRVLEGKQKPFVRDETSLSNYRANWNDSIHSESQVAAYTLRGLYVLLAHLKKTTDIERAAALIEKTGCVPLINQVNRLRTDKQRPRIDPVTGHRIARDTVTVRTVGLPEGVRLLANRDDVRAIAPGAQWGDSGGRAWIGTSWGLVRYRDTGRALDVLQIPTDAGIMTFCDTPAGLYVGTRDGLFRLDDLWSEEPRLIRVGVEKADGRQRDRVKQTMDPSGKTRTDRVHDAFPVARLLWWNDRLWVCSDGDVYRYDPRTKETLHLGRQGDALFAGCGKLWAERSVYDPSPGEFKAIETTQRDWRIIGSTEHEVWADADVNDELRHRPALLDPVTLSLTVLPLSGLASQGEWQSTVFRLLGESNGLVWLAGDNPGILVTYDREKKILRKTAGPVPAALTGAAGENISGALAAVKLNLPGDRGPGLSCIPLKNGRLLVGASIVREWQEDNLGYDDNDGMSHHVQDLEGGLFLVDPAAGTWRKIGTTDAELADFYVKRCVRDGDRLYVCSNGGVTILSLPDGKIVGRITVSEGLPSNKVEDVARIGDRLYLACELGDDGGGLAVMDLKTGLIQTLSQADGLKCDKIKRLRAEGDQLHILYGSIYSVRAYGTPLEGSVVAPLPAEVTLRWPANRPDDRVRTFRSSILDTKTGRIGDGDEILPGAVPPNLCGEEMPVLGGYTLVSNVEAGVSTILAGTHGLLMIPSTPPATLAGKAWPHEEVVIVRSARQQQVDEANRRPLDLETAAEVTVALNDPNPFYRTRAVAGLLGLLGREDTVSAYVPLLIHMLESPEVRERCTALFMLSRAQPGPAITAAYEKMLKDRDASVRGFAAIQLCRSGRIPDLEILREIVRGDHEYGNFPFGVDSSVGVEVERALLYAVLAPRATAPIFALMLDSPPPVSDYAPDVELLKQLAPALNEHPEAADVLLTAHDAPHANAQVRFASAVFGYAGTNQLPRLHAALSSKDRVVRSNAARACGAIRDPSSILVLIRALDMESGLARASIVTALGALKAREAMPRLTELYIDAQNDEKRRSGSGFMAAQSMAVQRAQYDSIRNLDVLAGDWNEIRETALAPPADPRSGEELLSPAIILEAVAQIGPSAARDFYRMLAGGKDADGRAEAAVHLADGEPADRDGNVTILKNLLSDGDTRVRIPAAVSLLLLHEEVARRPLFESLEGGELWIKRRIIVEFGRVKDHAQLEFARQALRAFVSDERQPVDVRHAADALLK